MSPYDTRILVAPASLSALIRWNQVEEKVDRWASVGALLFAAVAAVLVLAYWP